MRDKIKAGIDEWNNNAPDAIFFGPKINDNAAADLLDCIMGHVARIEPQLCIVCEAAPPYTSGRCAGCQAAREAR